MCTVCTYRNPRRLKMASDTPRPRNWSYRKEVDAED